MFEEKRATGRTTRLINEAARLARDEGRAVYILGTNSAHTRQLQRMVNEIAPGLGIQCETAPILFDWGSFRMPGAHGNCIWLIDHYTIESRFGHLFDEMTRFDREALLEPAGNAVS